MRCLGITKQSGLKKTKERVNAVTTDTYEAVELTSFDRCDVCSAAARVIATFINGQLMFCGHHAKSQKMLKEKAVSIYDPDNFLI